MVGSVATNDLMVFTGNANPELAKTIVQHLDIPLGIASVGVFSDGEISVEIGENVRGKDVFIIQPTCAPTNDNLMELMVMIDAVKRASSNRVTARVPITAKVVANMLTSVGVDRVLTIDLHADQIQGFFECLFDNVYASPILMGDIWKKKYPDMIVVSPDVGGVVRARAIAKQLDDADLAIIDKRRPRANQAQVMNIIGEVAGKTCIIVDDMVDTAGTLCKAADALKDHGAKGVYAYCTHPVLSGKAIENVANSTMDELVVTDTIPLSAEAVACTRIRQVSVAGLLAETIRRIHAEESVSSLYMD